MPAKKKKPKKKGAPKKQAKKAKAKVAKKKKAPVKKKAPAKKKAKKSAVKKKGKPAAQAPRQGVIPPVNGKLLGYVDDYFAKIGVIALTLKGPLALGNRIHVLGHTTDFEMPVGSMQIEHQPVTQAASSNGVGIKVSTRARRGDHVYLIP